MTPAQITYVSVAVAVAGLGFLIWIWQALWSAYALGRTERTISAVQHDADEAEEKIATHQIELARLERLEADLNAAQAPLTGKAA